MTAGRKWGGSKNIREGIVRKDLTKLGTVFQLHQMTPGKGERGDYDDDIVGELILLKLKPVKALTTSFLISNTNR